MTLKNDHDLYVGMIEALPDGILAVDKKGKVVYANQRFQSMWRIPDDLMAKRQNGLLLEFVCNQLVDPEKFLSKAQNLYQTVEIDFDVLEFVDGRFFERYSWHLEVNGCNVGRVWTFRDITEYERAQALIVARNKVLDRLDEQLGTYKEVTQSLIRNNNDSQERQR